jgi:acetoin utilization deacetylase AcuC-like enzyme
MSLIVISSERFVDHQTPPGHPEAPERATVMDVVAGEWRRRGGEVVAPRTATHEQLARVHDEAYLRRIAATAGTARALDHDTYTSPDSYEVALLAAGAAVDAVERVVGGQHQRAIALVRPPGHHAERTRAMGFCLFNNVAVAAAHARALGVPKVAIVDYDVHHGNGTQHLFEADPSVLYISLHQFPYYPGTGAADETGRGDGVGFTVNVPLEVGAGDADYALVFSRLVVPVLRQFTPGVLLVSAGFDAHARDPLAGMRLSSSAFAMMTRDLVAVADECCQGRIALVTEGGYDLSALGESLQGVIGALADNASRSGSWLAGASAPARGRAAVEIVRASLGGAWRLDHS